MKKIILCGLTAGLALTACTDNTQHSKAPAPEKASALVSTNEMDTYIQNWMEKTSFNGLILVEDGALSRSYTRGIAENGTDRTLTINSVFQTGSIDKVFATLAVFSLAEEDRLDIDAPITTYLPDYRVETGDRLTLAHLMTNRSGLPEGAGPLIGKLPGALKANPEASLSELGIDLSLAETVTQYGSGDLKFTPGAQFDYIYTNWILVHYILETVTGQPYEEILQERVFGPAAMTHSGVFTMTLDPDETGTDDIVVGYDAEDDYNSGDFPIPAMIGGATYTNAPDLLNLFDALYSGRLLSPKSLERFSTVTTEEENYAYGGRVNYYPENPEQLYSRQSGSNGATNVVAVHEIGGDYSFIAMSNFAQSQSDMFSLSRDVEKRFFNTDP